MPSKKKKIEISIAEIEAVTALADIPVVFSDICSFN
jgi:hypothetical protein